jgi:hypothetical protein
MFALRSRIITLNARPISRLLFGDQSRGEWNAGQRFSLEGKFADHKIMKPPRKRDARNDKNGDCTNRRLVVSFRGTHMHTANPSLTSVWASNIFVEVFVIPAFALN